jgi:hypothetical protein
MVPSRIGSILLIKKRLAKNRAIGEKQLVNLFYILKSAGNDVFNRYKISESADSAALTVHNAKRPPFAKHRRPKSLPGRHGR